MVLLPAESPLVNTFAANTGHAWSATSRASAARSAGLGACVTEVWEAGRMRPEDHAVGCFDLE